MPKPQDRNYKELNFNDVLETIESDETFKKTFLGIHLSEAESIELERKK